MLYNGSLTAIKLTFLLQYHRILGTGQMRKVIMVAFVLIAMWSISQLLVVIFTCTPIHKFWLPETPGTCIPNLPFWYANAAGNIVTDVIVFILPLPVLGRLNLRKSQKLALIGVFSLGFFVSCGALPFPHLTLPSPSPNSKPPSLLQTCAISVIRIQYLKLSNDVTWDNVSSSCWSIGELCSGITCACLPTLRPLLSRCLPGMRSQSGQSSDNKNKYYQHPSSGRDISGSDRLKSTDENASSRGIIYPEDIELQSDDRSDKEIRVQVGGLEQPRQQQERVRDKMSLGLRSTVRTEIKVGSPAPGLPPSSWPGGEGGIEVKRGFTVASNR